MKKLPIIAALLMAVLAIAEENLLTTVTGTAAQTAIVGYGKKVCIYCYGTDVRYRTGNSSTIVAATTTNSSVVPAGDCYRIQLIGANDRLSIINKDGSSTFTCDIHGVVP
jgi:hypothetical protein